MSPHDVVLKAIAEAAMTDTERLVGSMTLREDLYLDDFDLGAVVLEIQDALEIAIAGDGFGNWCTIGDVVAEVERLVKEMEAA